jgi:UPF0716 protein FxsA
MWEVCRCPQLKSWTRDASKGEILFPVIFLIFIAIPIIEIAVFIKVGGLIGVVPTIVLVIGFTVFGVWLLRQQGLQTFRRTQTAMNHGEMPVNEMMDGFFLVLAALLMVAPGLVTDAIGIVLLLPPVRRALGHLARRWVTLRSVNVQFGGPPPGQGSPPAGRGPIIEGEASEINEPSKTNDQDHRLGQDRSRQ